MVMAHGLAGQKDMGLEPFAEAFAARGLGVLMFDYRCFGGSDGEPRNWVSPKRHLQDWDAALGYVRVCAPCFAPLGHVCIGIDWRSGHITKSRRLQCRLICCMLGMPSIDVP